MFVPCTWNNVIFRISTMTGFTLPGMIDEPGCPAGNFISETGGGADYSTADPCRCAR